MKAKRGDVAHKLKIARGQLDGILQMIEADRYCVDISNQIMAKAGRSVETAGKNGAVVTGSGKAFIFPLPFSFLFGLQMLRFGADNAV